MRRARAGGYARDRGTVGEAVGAGLVNRIRRELLGDGLPREHRVVRIDAGVDEADGHPGTGLGVIALEQAEVGVGYVRLDVAQAPLVQAVSKLHPSEAQTPEIVIPAKAGIQAGWSGETPRRDPSRTPGFPLSRE